MATKPPSGTPIDGGRPAGTAASGAPSGHPGRVTAIVGLGSSAGGLEALTKLFDAMPSDSGMAFVIVAHLDPTHASLMAELVGRCTTMPVVQVGTDTPVESDHVYCIPPGQHLSISGRTLRLTSPIGGGSVRMPIDFFLRSLAAVEPEPVIGIVLSGTGSDGTIGLRHIKAAGGLAIAQDPASAEHAGMPRHAIDSGATDLVLSPEQIPGKLVEYVLHLSAGSPASLPRAGHVEPDALNELLSVLHGRVNFDFRSYKRSTLERRIARRMGVKHVDGIADYARLVVDDPVEAAALVDDLLISVTGFFRDPEAWSSLQEEVIRPLIQRKDAHATLRVWVPGCATGEEAYSVAMLLMEELQAAQRTTPIQIFASDVDTGALDFARAGLYPESTIADVPPERRRFFVGEDHAFRVHTTLREAVVFARQNLLTDPPFPNLDLICCRNVLMYFEAASQKRILSILHFALAEHGHLFLGSAESAGQEEDLFETVSRKWRIYRRVGPTRHDRLRLPITFATGSKLVAPSPGGPPTERFENLALQLLVDRFVPASVLINRRHEILYFAGPMQDYLSRPTGVPTQDLMARTLPGLETGLRRAVRKVIHDGESTVVTGVRVRRGDVWHRVRITAEPLKGPRVLDGLLLVSFADDPQQAVAVPDDPGPPSEQDEAIVRQLEDELRTMREDLQGSLEELQTSNQEMRVANEEVMSVNEELRSSNEELETSKEELQSLNEELTTVNGELNEKVLQLEQANNDLDNLLTSSNIATVFLDTSFRVRRFTPAATQVFDLTPADVGRPMDEVTQRCADPDLLRDAASVLATLRAISTEIQDRNGRWFVRQVSPYRTHDGRIEGIVITHSDVAAEALQEARLYAEAIVDTVREPLLVLDSALAVQSANRSFYQAFHVAPDETVGRPVYELAARQLDVTGLRTLLGEILRERRTVTGCEIQLESATLGRRTMLLNARMLVRGGGRPDLILLAIEDITERARAEHAVRDAAAMARAGVQTAIDGVVTIDDRATVLSFNPAAEHIFGFASGEVMGRHFRILMAPVDDDKSAAPLARYLHVGEREDVGRRKDGTTFPCDIQVSEFADDAGRRFVVTIRDVTERKHTEEQLRRHQGEMAHVLRVATIERFAAGLAHELNQPLTAIANDIETCSTYLRTGKRGARRLLALLDRAGGEALRAGDIVHHLRELVRRSEPQLESMDLRDVVRHATRWLMREMEQERIKLRLDFTTTKLPVRADRIQLEQVFVNLLQNAIDAIREARRPPREIRVRTARTENGMAEAAFDDTGTGVAAGAVERVYEPFFTTKPEGMGMGLAISLRIAEMHGGLLSVEPRASGVGTTVRLLLPLLEST